MSESRFSSIYLPQAVYEALPALYFLGGIATLLNLDHQLANLSGALLIVTAFHVSFMRVKARKFGRRALGGDGEMAMIGMSWLHHYRLGVPDIDDEHERLFELSHEVLETLAQTNGNLTRDALQELTEAVKSHFRQEELVLAEMGSPQARAHAKLHRRLETKLDSLMKKYTAGKIGRNEMAHFLLFEVVRQHMLEQDVQLVQLGQG